MIESASLKWTCAFKIFFEISLEQIIYLKVHFCKTGVSLSLSRLSDHLNIKFWWASNRQYCIVMIDLVVSCFPNPSLNVARLIFSTSHSILSFIDL